MPSALRYYLTTLVVSTCRICRQWRQIALSTPTLWRAISVIITKRDDSETLSRKLELLETWLKRSRNCRLSLVLKCLGYETPLPIMTQFLQVAVVHCQRWEHVNALVAFEHLHVIQGRMPLLRELIIGPSMFPHGQPDPLESIVLTRFFLKSVMTLPWSQLTHLTAHCVYEHECTAILRDATRLVVCTFDVCGSDDGIDVGPPVPVHANLRVLHLVVDSDDIDVQLWMVLGYLTLPALRTLQVSESCMTSDALAAFITRSQCTLEELCVIGATWSEAAIREALPPFGTIRLSP
ncbi:hypothetical protein B0H19DRAFT_1144905 [Mycena capillaripes]|nr:hypothetical protein B0H19DRAFT_1144905 [Mycena capillaripes]